jgi:hypothetical protein
MTESPDPEQPSRTPSREFFGKWSQADIRLLLVTVVGTVIGTVIAAGIIGLAIGLARYESVNEQEVIAGIGVVSTVLASCFIIGATRRWRTWLGLAFLLLGITTMVLWALLWIGVAAGIK